MDRFAYNFKINIVLRNNERRQWYANTTTETHPEHFRMAKYALVNGALYVSRQKSGNLTSPTANYSKWEKVSPSYLRHYKSWENYLNKLGATPAAFRGGPQTKKVKQ